jgi:hypothetical protein
MAILTLIFALTICSASYAAWNNETVQNDSNSVSVGSGNSLVLDSNDNPNIAYTDDGYANHAVKYAYKKGNKWYTETVDPNVGTYGGYTSLALNSYNVPSISYYDDNTKSLKYAYRSANSSTMVATWTIETVGKCYGSYGNSLVLDSSNTPHIAYYDSPSGSLTYATRIGTKSWNKEAVDSSTTSDCKLILNDRDSPNIIYLDNSRTQFKHAYKSSGTWHIENVSLPLVFCSEFSISMNSNNDLGISYVDQEAAGIYKDNLKYAYTTSSGWKSVTVDNSGNINSYTSIVLDSSNNPYIVYSDSTQVKYTSGQFNQATAKWTWVTSKIVNGAAEWKSLALNSKGLPSFSYYYPTNMDLKYAYYTIDKTAPKIVSTYPKNKAKKVSRTKTIYIKFSEKIKTSINWSKIVIKNKYGKNVKIAKKWISRNVLYVKTKYKRSSYSYYTVYIPKAAVKDYANNNLASGYIFKFKTGK